MAQTIDISYRGMERVKILTRLERHDLTRAEAAEALGISERQLLTYMFLAPVDYSLTNCAAGRVLLQYPHDMQTMSDCRLYAMTFENLM